MKVWELIRALKRLPNYAKVYYVDDADINPADQDLIEVGKVEEDPHGEIVLS